MAHNYLPGPDNELLPFAQVFIAYLSTKASALGIDAAIVAALATKVTAFQDALAVTNGPHTSVDTKHKSNTRKMLEAAIREFVNEYIRYNHLVTDEDRTALGLPIPDTTRTPVRVPVTQCIGKASNPGEHQVEAAFVSYTDVLTGDERARYGVRIYYGFMPPGGATMEEAAGEKHYLMHPPVDGAELPNSVFTRKRKYLFDFNGEGGKTVYFSLRFENPSGESGPFGPIFSTIIT